MSYENPNRVRYVQAAVNSTAGGVPLKVRGPKGKAGRVYDYGFGNVSTAFTNTTTGAKVSVGRNGVVEEYGKPLDMLATPTGGGRGVRSAFGSVAERKAYLTDKTIPADTEVFVTVTAPTGGTPAGTGNLFVIIDWDD